jgi:hypothetical protein
MDEDTATKKLETFFAAEDVPKAIEQLQVANDLYNQVSHLHIHQHPLRFFLLALPVCFVCFGG